MPRGRKKQIESISPEPVVREISLKSEELKARPSLEKPVWKQKSVVIQSILLLIAIGAAGYFYYQYRMTPEVSQQKEIERLVKEVGRIVDLPENEVPTLATVTNKGKLDSQPFFQRAENGDKILIYRTTSRAFLYRPSTKKLIDVTMINIEMEKSAEPPAENTPSLEQSGAEQESPVVGQAPQSEEGSSEKPAETVGAVAAKPLRVALYNGSATVGVTYSLEEKLKLQFPDIEVVLKEKASKNSYDGNFVVDVTGENASAARSIAEFVSGTVSALPATENLGPDEIDILIIVGNGT